MMIRWHSVLPRLTLMDRAPDTLGLVVNRTTMDQIPDRALPSVSIPTSAGSPLGTTLVHLRQTVPFQEEQDPWVTGNRALQCTLPCNLQRCNQVI